MVTRPIGPVPPRPQTVYVPAAQLGVEAGNDISARGSAAPDHCVGVMASGCTIRGDVDLRPEAAFVRVKDKGTDFVADVQDQCVWWPGAGPGPS